MASQKVDVLPLLVHIQDENESDQIRQVELNFHCDWDVGIGGSVWTSGEILTSHLQLEQQRYQALFRNKQVIELGSGTGYVGLMTAVAFQPAQVILTDLDTHIECLQKNIDSNAKHVNKTTQVRAMELSWGSSEQEDTVLKFLEGSNVDIILGTDVAYLRDLYEPLLHTLVRLSTTNTMILFGMNRTDTNIQFFKRLEEEGFEYYKISDHRLLSQHQGTDFGLFEIKRRVPQLSIFGSQK